LSAGWWFSLGTPVSSTNKTDCHDITAISLKMALNCYSAGFPYRLSRLKPRASISRGPQAKVNNIFVIIIDLSYTCCHELSVIFLALHFRIIRPINRY
jgi:hypothetical protein